jgi:tetratricopeptide (TPR) repeat protein
MKQLDDAESLLQQALTLMHHNSEYWYAAELYRLQGELHLQREDFPAAEVALQQALKLAQDQGAQAWESRILDSLKGLESTQSF